MSQTVDHLPRPIDETHAVASASPRDRWPALVLIVVLGAALRLHGLDDQSLWMDEVLSVVSSRAPLSAILTAPPVDPNIPPLYYLLLWALRGLGEGEVALRLPSALAGIASIPVLYAIAAAWLGRPIGLAAAFALAVSPLHVWYSQEARPYALLILLALLSAWSFQQAQRSPRAYSPRVAFAILGAATFYLHTVAVAFLAALALYVLATTPRRELGGWAATFAGLAVLCLPGLYLLVRVPPTVTANSAYRFDPSHVAYTLWTYVTGYSLGPNLVELRVDGMGSVRRNLPLIASVLGAVALLLAHGMARLWPDRRRALTALLLWAVCPVAFTILGAWATSHPYNVRYTLLALPPTLILLAAGIVLLPGAVLRGAAGAVVVAVSLWSLRNYAVDPQYQRDDNRGAAAFLRSHAAAGDLVITSAAYTRLPLNHYLGDAGLHVIGYPMSPAEAPEGAELGAAFVEPERLSQDFPGLVGNRAGFHLFLSRTFHSDPDGHLRRHAEGHYQRVDRFTGAGVEVLSYRRADPSGPPAR